MAMNEIARRSCGAPVGSEATRRQHRPGTMAWAAAAAAVALLGAAVATTAAPAAAAGTTELVSVATGGAPADRGAFGGPAISQGGRFVAFATDASNLAPGDTNGTVDVFVRDRAAGTTERISVGPGGVQGNELSCCGAISADGRYVAFLSAATNLVPGDTNGANDIFVRDRRAGRTELVSVGPGGVQSNGGSCCVAISAAGRFVAFSSTATNLAPGGTGGFQQVFIRDRAAGTTERVSVGAGGAPANSFSESSAIAPGGRFVAFESFASNLVPGDTNRRRDVFVRDRVAGTTERVSVGAGGVHANQSSGAPTISAGGRFVAFASIATNLLPGVRGGVFVRDRVAGTTELVSVGPGGAPANIGGSGPAMSTNGRYIVFQTLLNASSGINASFVIFVRDRSAGTTERVDVGPGGVPANDGSFGPAISPGGRFVAFYSYATNLVPGVPSGVSQVYLRAR